ncbi:MAG: hypothetical protein LBR74_04720 [Eubacterium sp.]|jgi:hypothetical protein|nr:hypothetical protein [Eubacterium sp.]
MAVISIQTKKVPDLPEKQAVGITDQLMIHDGTGLKRVQAGLLLGVKNEFQGIFDPATGKDEYGDDLPAPATENSTFFWVSTGNATWTPPGGSTAIAWKLGDWCISDSVKYDRVPFFTIDMVARQSLDIVQNMFYELLNSDKARHNSIYRGKYLGDAVTDAQYTAISTGKFDDLFIGDYWTIGGVNYRIAAFDYYYRSGDTDLTIHHVTIVPDTSFYDAQMNATNTTTGGYTGSAMRATNLEDAKTAINAAFPDHVLTHRQYLVNSVTNGRAGGGAWFDCSVELMNEIMVYGTGMFSPVSDGTNVPLNYTVSKSQLPLFFYRPDLISNRQSYWLRDVVSNSLFANVNYAGDANARLASSSYGVRPSFSLYRSWK